METKVNTEITKIVSNKIGYPCSFIVPIDGPSGGLWLFWKSSATFELDIISSTNRFIHTLLKGKIKNISWFSMFTYGFPQHHLQRRLWN